MRIRQLFREQKKLKRLEQTFLWKWNYSKVTCIMGTPQIYLSRQRTGKKILWHIPTSRKDFFGTAEKKNRFVFLLFGNHFFEVIEAQTEAEKAISCETQVLKPFLMNVKKWRFCRTWNRKIYRFSFLRFWRGEESKSYTYFRFATHWNLLLKCFHLFSINNLMLFFSFLSLSLPLELKTI